ncbi:hypothetical protein EPUS_00242 [Endocarpon pusillum Z07020]|uniref:DUF8035 domain-containing protein n=1 Tax=Endocarpon pusillum (strain Z07020 / HMAS-L-300199) TaxID=1263415 RepID=U1HIM1_ENDPU|nr:uncharacterized protein EPUS_00242 [Endocarpon pusillum Z07020]ERF70055.1 hypothetical protein EPUS_00242 [Endocarpon pusillum Z07020]
MAGRRFAPSEVSDRYETRRDYARSEIGRRDERIWEEELEYRSRPPPPRGRERTTVVKEEVRVKERSPPDFLRENYGRTTSGPVVLRAREREDFEFVPRPRRRSPSPELERKIEREEIIVRKEPEVRREPPPPPRDYEREEIIVRREDRTAERARPPPPREVERDELIVRREERGGNPRYSAVYERNDVIDRRPPPRDDYEREEIIIRRDRDDSRDAPRYRGRDDPYPLPRAVSHERERSRMGRGRSGSDTDEIIIRRDEREGRNGREREREEIIIRRHDSRSPSPASSRGVSVRPPPEPPIINAPAIHQEVITHHRHVDHGYELALAPIAPPARFRPPSPPTPPQEEERIEIRRRGEKNGRAYDEDIIIDRNQSRSAPPTRDRQDDDLDRAALYATPAPSRRPAPPERWRDPRDSRDIQEEAEYYNQRALDRTYPGEGYHGSTADWAIVDVPPGTRRVRMDGAGGGAQEITWQRYNGVRRSKFMPDGSDEGYGSEVGRPAPAPAPAPAAAAAGGEIGRRYMGVKDPREGMWTEITKDLVVKEAIVEAGYEFEETDDFFYVIAYLKYEDVARLVGLSEDIRHARRKRMKEIDWERRALPPPEAPRRPLAIEDAPSRPAPGPWDREDERVVEREWYRPRAPPPRW